MVDYTPSFMRKPTPITPRERPDFFRIDDLEKQIKEVPTKDPLTLGILDEDFRARWWNVEPAANG